MIFVTGGAGFIGCNFINYWFKKNDEKIINIDNLSFYKDISHFNLFLQHPKQELVNCDIQDKPKITNLLEHFSPRAIVHFAAETHVDRSILSPEKFINNNILGTFNLLNASKSYWDKLSTEKKQKFRFINISTDEVFGSLEKDDPPFLENNRYLPNSPYSASKASTDHILRSYYHTYGFPGITTHCSNNYGPFQYPEKLIPLMVYNSLSQKKLPIYGNGLQVRDWLHVRDHCEALAIILEKGNVGETYNIGGNCEKKNIEVVKNICSILQEVCPRENALEYINLIEYIKDRPGHDIRYSINTSKIYKEFGWRPKVSFEKGLKDTIIWYLENMEWLKKIAEGKFSDWVNIQYK